MIPQGDENPFRDNPYASPDLQSTECPQPNLTIPPHNAVSVAHVPAMAILMIVQGAFEVLMGSGLIAMGAVVPKLMQANSPSREDRPRDHLRRPSHGLCWRCTVSSACWTGRGGRHVVAGIRQLYVSLAQTLGIIASDHRHGDHAVHLLLCRLPVRWASMDWSAT